MKKSNRAKRKIVMARLQNLAREVVDNHEMTNEEFKKKLAAAEKI